MPLPVNSPVDGVMYKITAPRDCDDARGSRPLLAKLELYALLWPVTSSPNGGFL